MLEEDVIPQDTQPEADQVVEQMQEDNSDQNDSHNDNQNDSYVEKQVPLSALQKERKKRQELEMQIEYERSQRSAVAAPPEEDLSKYESATREDLSRMQGEAVRMVEEKLWIKSNPEKYEKVNELLPEFLKQRPNLTRAINDATNRYEEAWTLMEALSPKQQQAIRQPVPRKEAPGNPASIPKGASLNHAVDVMTMTDTEFSKWRQEQKRRR